MDRENQTRFHGNNGQALILKNSEVSSVVLWKQVSNALPSDSRRTYSQYGQNFNSTSSPGSNHVVLPRSIILNQHGSHALSKHAYKVICRQAISRREGNNTQRVNSFQNLLAV
ncbi:hypothetical protein KC19_VG120200 [Ceratodon purpureus]|uniref:Uncharacterized protein n=1 Tax=Ceratodon purpureus TaxID=3225 RepID=A0A8T0HPG4_CERPU|nr:hypothetical protein KC19_VG120200 [Ceratodon purpureus]